MNDYPEPHEPDPADLVIPDIFTRPLPPEHQIAIGLEEIGGVPLPYYLQCVPAFADIAKMVDAKAPTEDLVTAMRESLAAPEQKYPSPAWDNCRSHFASFLLDRGEFAPAVTMISGMHSPHRMVRAIENQIIKRPEDPQIDMLYAEVYSALEAANPPKFLGFVRALADKLISYDPDSPNIVEYEVALSQRIPDFDPLASWAESLASQNDRLDAESTIAFVSDDEVWQGVPFNERRHAYTVLKKMQEKLLKEALEWKDIEWSVQQLDKLERRTPAVDIWDELRLGFAEEMLVNDMPEFSVLFGERVKNSEILQQIITSLASHEEETAALELTNYITDVQILWQTLCAGSLWHSDAGIKRWEEILSNPGGKYPLERQIACIELASAKFAEAGETGLALKWQSRLDQLRALQKDTSKKTRVQEISPDPNSPQ